MTANGADSKMSGFPDLPLGVWFLEKGSLLSVWHGRNPQQEEVVLLYRVPGLKEERLMAVGTVLRGADWAESSALVQYDTAFARHDIPAVVQDIRDDTLPLGEKRLFRTRVVIGGPLGRDVIACLRDGALEPSTLRDQRADLARRHGSDQ